MRSTVLVLLGYLLVASAIAQTTPPDPKKPVVENLKTPTDWHVRLDKPNAEVVVGDDDQADIFFVAMVPGWHITTGPRAIFWHPGLSAEGSYRIESTIFLFDPGERREAFGILYGGSDLDGEEIAYDYFVLRNSGEYLIKRRRGAETEVIRDWTAHEAIVTYGPDSEDSVKNVLAVEAGGERVRFLVNGVEVASVPRGEVATDGYVGLRVNHHLNLHVSDVKVTPGNG